MWVTVSGKASTYTLVFINHLCNYIITMPGQATRGKALSTDFARLNLPPISQQMSASGSLKKIPRSLDLLLSSRLRLRFIAILYQPHNTPALSR